MVQPVTNDLMEKRNLDILVNNLMDPDLRRLTKKNSFTGEISEDDTLVNFEVLFAKPENRKHFLKKIFDRIEK